MLAPASLTAQVDDRCRARRETRQRSTRIARASTSRATISRSISRRRRNVIRGYAVLLVRHTTRVDTLVLDLVDLTVDSVRMDGTRVPLHAHDRTKFTSRYHPRGKQSRRASRSRTTAPVEDGLIVRTDSAGRWTGFGDNWPNRARHWIPSVDHPSDKATVTLDASRRRRNERS